MSNFAFWLRFRKNLSLAQFLTLCTFLELCYKLVSHSSHFVLSLSFVTTMCFTFGFVFNFATIVCCNFSFELWTLCFCWLVICASKEVFKKNSRLFFVIFLLFFFAMPFAFLARDIQEGPLNLLLNNLKRV